MFLEIVKTFTATFLRFKFFTTSSTKKSSAALNQVTNTAGVEFNNFIRQHSFVAVINTENFNAFVNRSPNYGTRRRIHTRTIAARCHYRYCSSYHKVCLPTFQRVIDATFNKYSYRYFRKFFLCCKVIFKI